MPNPRSTIALEDTIDPIEWRYASVPLAALPHPDGPVANRALKESIAQIGILTPILLASRDGIHPPYRIIDGCRRVIAAHEAGLVDVPARIAPLDEMNAAILTLICNHQRSPNPVAEVAAVEYLGSERLTETDVAQLTGVPVQTIRKRMRVRNLIPEFAEMFVAGDLTAALAEELCKQPEREQREVYGRVCESEKLTHGLLQDARSVRREAAIVELLPALEVHDEQLEDQRDRQNPAGTLSAGGVDPIVDLLGSVRRQLWQVQDPQVVRNTDRLLGEIEGHIRTMSKAVA